MGYEIDFEKHKGLGAFVGMASVVLGAINPVLGLLPKTVAICVTVAGGILAGISNKPGAMKAPVVTLDPMLDTNTVRVAGRVVRGPDVIKL